MTLQEIEALIGVELPPEAKKRSWWYNNHGRKASYWQSKDYKVDYSNLVANGFVCFKRTGNANNHKSSKFINQKSAFVKKVDTVTRPKGILQTRIIPIGAFLFLFIGAVFVILNYFRPNNAVSQLEDRLSVLEQSRQVHEEMALTENFYFDTGDVKNEYKDSLMLTLLAEDGEAIAQFFLGMFYLYGTNFLYGNDIDSLTFFRDGHYYPLIVDIERIQNFELAEKWLIKAAQNENAPSYYQYTLGLIYLDGIWGNSDYLQAEKWFRRAAMRNHTYAMIEIARLYINGHGGLHRSHNNALYWIRKSIDLGNVAGTFALGEAYFWGRGGVEKCYEEAAYWFNQSANAGFVRAQIWLASMHLNGMIEQYDMQRGYESLRTIAENGDAEAQHNLGILYHRGIHVGQCYRNAIEWFRKSADQNFVKSYFMLGLSYQNNLGVPFHMVQAIEWYAKMLREGSPFEQNLAHITLLSISDSINVILDDDSNEVFAQLEDVFAINMLVSAMQELAMANLFHQQFAQIIQLHLFPIHMSTLAW